MFGLIGDSESDRRDRACGSLLWRNGRGALTVEPHKESTRPSTTACSVTLPCVLHFLPFYHHHLPSTRCRLSVLEMQGPWLLQLARAYCQKLFHRFGLSVQLYFSNECCDLHIDCLDTLQPTRSVSSSSPALSLPLYSTPLWLSTHPRQTLYPYSQSSMPSHSRLPMVSKSTTTSSLLGPCTTPFVFWTTKRPY